MSAAGIKVATTSSKAIMAAGIYEDGINKNKENTPKKTDCALISNNLEENSSFFTLPSLGELQTSLFCDVASQRNIVPLENSKQEDTHQAKTELESAQTLTSNKDLDDFTKSQLRQDQGETTTTQLCPGLSLLQQTVAASSPPPHSYRHSRAYRHFKNPPQPHMCIRTTTDAGEELFINVLSWTRIVIPQEPSDPIPLYGGMRVPPGSPRSPPIVFAVMANPEVLKDSGRHSKDPEERRAMVELMCDFVEAMNPGVKLVRNAIILKDRDISGELKDVWNAVQAQRDREREEQMLLQRQQHFHNLTNVATNGSPNSNSSMTSSNSAAAVVTNAQQMTSKPAVSNESITNTFAENTPPRARKNIPEVQNDITSNIDLERNEIEMTKINNGQISLSLLAEHLNTKISLVGADTKEEYNAKQQSIFNNQNALTNDALNNGKNSKDYSEMEKTGRKDNQSLAVNCRKDAKKEQQQTNGSVLNCHNTEILNSPLDTVTSPNAAPSNPAQTPLTTNAPLSTVPAKKEKLGGFLPNGCIFPRFTKNNKHKDKDKDKEKDKEPKTKEKEKNALLSALKKNKDKKSNAAAISDEKNTSSNTKITATTNCNNPNLKQQKNCLQQPLECGVQKLDLNNHHHHIHIDENNINKRGPSLTNDSSETNKNTSSTINNSDGVGVH